MVSCCSSDIELTIKDEDTIFTNRSECYNKVISSICSTCSLVTPTSSGWANTPSCTNSSNFSCIFANLNDCDLECVVYGVYEGNNGTNVRIIVTTNFWLKPYQTFVKCSKFIFPLIRQLVIWIK